MKSNLWKIGTLAIVGLLLFGAGFITGRFFGGGTQNSQSSFRDLLGGNQNKVVPIKAAIIYSLGGPQPVARTKFFLVKESLEQIEKKTGSSIVVYKDEVDENLIKDFLVASTTTDFEGNGKFENIPKGTYYILGATPTRGGHANWSLKVDVGEKMDTVYLDSQNAREAK